MRTTTHQGITLTEAAAIEGCAALILGWVLRWGTGAVHAAVAMKGWEWFVADTFGLPTLSLIQAWGLFALISFATYQFHDTESEYTPFAALGRNLALSLLLSGFAFVGLLILSVFL